MVGGMVPRGARDPRGSGSCLSARDGRPHQERARDIAHNNRRRVRRGDASRDRCRRRSGDPVMVKRLVSMAAVALLVPLACAVNATAQTTTVDFDNPAPPGASFDLLNGVFQGIDFGTGQWRW